MRSSEAVAQPVRRQPITLRMRALHRVSRQWPGAGVRLRNVAPLLTVTFDDVPDSAVAEGAGVLEAAGARGTFFVATSLFGAVTPDWRVADADEVAALAARGHEIGLHSHRHLPAAHMGVRAFEADLGEAERRLAAMARVENYAYPFGFSNLVHRPALRRRVRSSRTTHPGLNHGTADPHGLKSYALGEVLSDPAALDRLLDETVNTGGWLILTIHDVRASPSPYGCTPALLRHALEGARARSIAIATVTQALDACGVPGLNP